MQFYKTGRVIYLQGGRLELDSPEYNHKALFLSLDSSNDIPTMGEIVSINFYKSPDDWIINLSPIISPFDQTANTNRFTNGLIPARVKRLEFSNPGGLLKLNVLLLN
jgi:hypothetical protein